MQRGQKLFDACQQRRLAPFLRLPGLWREDASSSAPNRTIEGRIRSRNVASSSWTFLHRLDSAVTSFHVECRRSPNRGLDVPSSSPRTNMPPWGDAMPSPLTLWGTMIRRGAHRSKGSNQTFIPAKWTLTDATDGLPVTPSLRGGWGHDKRARAILARGCTPSFALAASLAASSAAAARRTVRASTVVCCARREAWTTGHTSRRTTRGEDDENLVRREKKKKEGGGGFRRSWGRQRSEQDVGRDEATAAKDPAAPGAKDIVVEKDGGKSAHGSRDEDGRLRNPPRQRGRQGSAGLKRKTTARKELFE